MASITLNALASDIVAEHASPIMTDYEFGIALFKSICAGKRGRASRRLKTHVPERRHYTTALNFLTEHRILRPVRGKTRAFARGPLSGDYDVEHVVCAMDPFGYLSHLSAMQFHGLTDRFAKGLYFSTPDNTNWSTYANERMLRDLGAHLDLYLQQGFPPLVRGSFTKIEGRTITVTRRKHLGAFKNVRADRLRVSTIGRTFLDMLREPDECGGIRHVLSVFAEHAPSYLGLIVDDIDAHGTAIDKVRAGYLLSERLGLEHPTIDGWVKFASRGGSRKLYAKDEYSATYSERWCLSLNVDA